MLVKYRKFGACVLVLFVLAFPVRRSEAVLPLIAGWLLTIGGSTLITDIGFGITGLLAGAIWYDCNKFTNMSVCTNKPASMPANTAPPAVLTVNLTPDGKRANPDPQKFNDPVGGNRDVTPKSKVLSRVPAPSAAPGVPSPPSSPPPTLVDTVSYVNLSATGVNGDGMDRWRYEKSHANGDARIVTVFYTHNDTPGQITATTVIYQAITVPLSQPISNSAGLPQVDIDAIKNATNDAMAALRADYPQAWDPTYNPVFTRVNPAVVGDQVWRTGVGLQFAPQSVKYGCDPGYSPSGDSCILSDATQIQKPSSTPCEVLYDATAKSLMTDPANPNCVGQATVNGSNMTTKSSGDNTSISITPNGAGGFDITKTNADGTTLTVSTGPYDVVGHGYPITGTKSGNGKDPDGVSCGVPGFPACNVAMSLDAATQSAQGTAQSGITNGVGALQGSVNSISDRQFNWNFIPQIPSAKCVDPSIRNPLNDTLISMPICQAFNGLSFFINCVLAVLCLYGCKQQVQAALKA